MPQAPTNSNSVAAVITGSPIEKCPLRASAVTSENRSDPNYHAMVNMPSRNPASPMRFTMNALFAAVLADLR